MQNNIPYDIVSDFLNNKYCTLLADDSVEFLIFDTQTKKLYNLLLSTKRLVWPIWINNKTLEEAALQGDDIAIKAKRELKRRGLKLND